MRGDRFAWLGLTDRPVTADRTRVTNVRLGCGHLSTRFIKQPVGAAVSCQPHGECVRLGPVGGVRGHSRAVLIASSASSSRSGVSVQAGTGGSSVATVRRRRRVGRASVLLPRRIGEVELLHQVSGADA